MKKKNSFKMRQNYRKQASHDLPKNGEKHWSYIWIEWSDADGCRFVEKNIYSIDINPTRGFMRKRTYCCHLYISSEKTDKYREVR